MPRLRSVSPASAPGSCGVVPPVKPLDESLPLPPHVELARQLDGLPKDLGFTLLVVGTFGIVIPGPIPPGFSFILLGVIALQPCLIERSGAPLARRFPRLFRILIGLVSRFRSDLERRYPGSVPHEIATRPARGAR